ncbi:MAG: DUF1761 domain-containing protein [Actinomycetota bacterium]
MPHVTIDWLGVIVATVTAMVVGGVWYHVFQDSWMGYIGKTREELQAQGGLGYLIALLGAFVSAIVMTYVTQWAGAGGFGEGTLVGVVMWAGFVLSTLVTGSVFEGRPWGLIMINSGNSLLTFLLVGGIVAAFN